MKGGKRMNHTIRPSFPDFVSEFDIIGLDLDDVAGMRLVYLGFDLQASEHFLADHRRFYNLARFKSYWARNPHCHVAVSKQTADPQDVMQWLASQGARIIPHSNPGWKWTRLGLREEFAMWGLPRAYERAYTVAFLTTYRLQAAKIVGLLATQANCLQEMLTEFEQELSRLRDAMPDPDQRGEDHALSLSAAMPRWLPAI
jgi:hypothetical protein